MAATPTASEIAALRSNLPFPAGKTADSYIALAFAQLKRDLEDRRGIEWAQVYVNDAYLGDGRNEDRCKHLMSLLTIALTYQDYAIETSTGGNWWELYLAYRADYDEALKTAKLDVDTDGDGAIDTDESARSGQTFLRR